MVLSLNKMRISLEMQQYFHHCIDAGDEIYLFGSRVDDNKRGGDIDIFILSQTKYSSEKINHIKMVFMKKFGQQKLDLVNWTHKEECTFKDLVKDGAIKL